jgi:hypothetical protein
MQANIAGTHLMLALSVFRTNGYETQERTCSRACNVSAILQYKTCPHHSKRRPKAGYTAGTQARQPDNSS